MSKSTKLSHLQATKLPVPADDSRDESFHLDINKKNSQMYVTSKPK